MAEDVKTQYKEDTKNKESKKKSSQKEESIQPNLFWHFRPRILDEIKKERPTGLLGNLYDEICKYGTNNPRGEIERMADDALYRGIISKREYTVLKHRISFHGTERETLKKLGERFHSSDGFHHICRNAVRYSETNAYGKLYRYYIKGAKYKGEQIEWPMGY